MAAKSLRKRKIDKRNAELDAEEAALLKREQFLNERKNLAAAFHPFEKPEDYTKNEARAIFDVRGLTLDAIEKLNRNYQKELGTKAMMLDGAARDKPMWMALGSQMLIENIKLKIKQFDGTQAREKEKVKAQRRNAPKEEKRDVTSLYKNPPGMHDA